jgi:cytochrome c
MGELGFNKIFGAILAIGLAVLGVKEVSTIVFGGAHHGSTEYASEKEWAGKYFPGWDAMIKETGAGGVVIEEIYDLGLLLLTADVAKGERSFKGKCASCHTIEEGGANGTGPALWDTMGAAKQSHAGFNYSGALGNTEGDWSWERMDAWLENPSSYARGTSMAFAGLKRDDERANVLAYLAEYSTKTPPMPEPLPVVEEAAEGEAVESVDAGTLETDPALATGEIIVQDTNPGENVEMIVEETADDIEATLEGEGNDVIEEVTDPALEE